jgi:hypothetical protein
MKRGVKTIVAGAGLLLLALAVPILLVVSLFQQPSAKTQFLAPGSAQATIDQSGRYYLWNDHHVVFQGQTFANSVTLEPGVSIQIIDLATGEPLPFVGDEQVSLMWGGSSSQSVGYVDFSGPAKVRVEMTGNAQPRVVSFSRFNFAAIFGRLMAGGCFAFVAGLTGVGLIIWGIVKFATAKAAAPAGSIPTA